MVGVEKLRIGEEYTYRQLCEMFGEEQKGGNSKKAQLNRWGSYFRWINPTTQKYRVEEIYSTPREIEDKRKDNGGKNTGKFSDIDNLIMDLLSDSDDIKITIPRLAEKIGILSEQYGKHRFAIEEFCENNGYSRELVSEYLYGINSCVHRAIKSAIERLKDGGFICSDDYYVLKLTSNSNEILSNKKMRYFETKTEATTGIKQFSEKSPIQEQKFRSSVRSLIEKELGISIKYYYKEYHLKKMLVDYSGKSNSDMWRLTRKMVFTIGCKMIKCIYRLANQKHIDDPVTGNTYLISEDYDSDAVSNMLKSVIELSNYFFVYMNNAVWNAYLSEDELGDKDKDLTFMTALLWGTISRHDENKNLSIHKEKIDAPKVYGRKQAIDGLGLEDVEEIERILPNIDWERVWFDEEYAIRFANAIGEYYRQLDMFTYSKEKYVNEYSLYVARLAVEGRLDEQMHFFGFVHHLDESDTRYMILLQ